MNYQKHQSKKTLEDFLASFSKVHQIPRPNQLIVLSAMPDHPKILLQAPTGTGKTGLGYAFLKTHAKDGTGIYVCPSKTNADGVVQTYPEIKAMYGRNEYPCLYYKSEYKADEVPCSLLRQCPHRVDMLTGHTFEMGATPCPYFQAKFNSRHGKILIACTFSYFFFEALQRPEQVDALVVDEGHEWSNSMRRMLSYNITDTRLDEFWVLLGAIECLEEAKLIRDFRDLMIEVIKEHSSGGRAKNLLTDESLKKLLNHIMKLKRTEIDLKIKNAIESHTIDIEKDRELLRDLDRFTGDLQRYVKSLEFALGSENRTPLSFVYGHWNKKEKKDMRCAEYTLTIQSYSIAGLTRKKLLPETYMVMSATLGKPNVLAADAGFDGHFIDLLSEFPIENSRIFMADDIPDLSTKNIQRNDKNKILRRILKACKTAKESEIRSLIIVISEEERLQCVKFAKEEGVVAISYDKGLTARDAVKMFKDGEGDVLIGTEAQYGQGIDLPDGICPFIFYLRPGYPTPDSPQAQFEERSMRNYRWSIWIWRVILKMLQTRGRSIRSVTDKGCIFLMSKQFKRFTYGGLPEWLRPAYVGQIKFDDALQKGIELVKK